MAHDPGLLVSANALPVGVFRTDLDGRCLSISERVADLTGLSAEDARQFGWERSVHPDDREVVSRQIQSALDARTAWQADFRCRRPDGSIRWILGQATPEFDAQGHVIGFVGTLIDTTRSQEARRASEERDAFLLKLSDAIRPMSDPLDVQEAAARLLGERLAVNRVGYVEIDGQGFTVRREYVRGVPPLQGPGPTGTFGAALDDAYRRGETVVVNDVRTDPRFTDRERIIMHGRQIAAFVGVMLLKGGQLVAAFGANHATPRLWAAAEIELIRDVAERTWEAAERARAEAALRQREQRLRLALDASAGGSWSWDASTNRVEWDDGFRARYGFTPDEPPAFEKWLSRVHEDDRPQVLAQLDETRRTGRVAWDCTHRIVRADGAVLWIQSLGRAERDVTGKVTRLTGLEFDVTERRRADEALQARRDEERDRELRLLLETAAQGIVSVDGQGLIVTANRALEVMFGWASGELIGQSLERLLPVSLPDIEHRTEHVAAAPVRCVSTSIS